MTQYIVINLRVHAYNALRIVGAFKEMNLVSDNLMIYSSTSKRQTGVQFRAGTIFLKPSAD